MFSRLNRVVSNMLGASQPDSMDCYLSEIRNDAAKEMKIDISVCLTPQIEEGTRLSFVLSPVLRNEGGGWNLLGHVRNTLNLENGERVVIMSIKRMHTHNELNGELHFLLEHPFDNDPATQTIRNRIDTMLATDDKETTIERGGNNNNNVGPLGGGGDGEMLASDMETDPSVRALVDRAPPLPSSSSTLDEETVKQMDAITIRGARIYRNKAEMNNSIDLYPIKANKTVYKEKMFIYRASVSSNIVKWFAGQDRFIVEDPIHQVLTRANTEEADLTARAKRPVIPYLIYPDTHSLIMFIKMFAEDLNVQQSEMRPLRTDRDTGGLGQRGSSSSSSASLYQVDKTLVDRAREMILHVVYPQMYYTTLRDCRLIRQVESEEQEFALLHRLASDWGLTVNPQTKHVSDWANGQYRPQVVVTLRVKYFLIHSVSNTAAALHTERVRLSVK